MYKVILVFARQKGLIVAYVGRWLILIKPKRVAIHLSGHPSAVAFPFYNMNRLGRQFFSLYIMGEHEGSTLHRFVNVIWKVYLEYRRFPYPYLIHAQYTCIHY